ncbi:MAG: hypothetical protein HOK67_16120 [Deltaproteobacteria bacterium]|nr:hypothetical protein [Desulfobacula sp.]MBT4201351.1 hypothetical protein [Desulfobacula sp.]MBT4638906.1 hypothetical protein [Deltaproteobacteria bacterium]MBT6501423.1 hypothetical protein [Deltaproteobacteria bacterium]
MKDRFFAQDLLDNKGITRDELSKLVSDYYKLRGWYEKGIPVKKKIWNLQIQTHHKGG